MTDSSGFEATIIFIIAGDLLTADITVTLFVLEKATKAKKAITTIATATNRTMIIFLSMLNENYKLEIRFIIFNSKLKSQNGK
jgi:hypothetical protein